MRAVGLSLKPVWHGRSRRWFGWPGLVFAVTGSRRLRSRLREPSESDRRRYESRGLFLGGRCERRPFGRRCRRRGPKRRRATAGVITLARYFPGRRQAGEIRLVQV